MDEDQRTCWHRVAAAVDRLGLVWEEVSPACGQLLLRSTQIEETRRAAVVFRTELPLGVPLVRIDAIDVRSFGEEALPDLFTAVNLWHAVHGCPAVAVEADPEDTERHRLRAVWMIPLGTGIDELEAALGLAFRSLVVLWRFLADAGVAGLDPWWVEAERGVDQLEVFLRAAEG